LFVAACLTPASPVHGADADSDTIEEIIVSGSRIPRPDFESASPIVTVPGEEFRQSASASVETVLHRLPQFVPDNGAFPSPTPGDPGGRATLNLRGLGAHSTLVLLDGKRLVPSFGDGAVDVNIIPPALRRFTARTQWPVSSTSSCANISRASSWTAAGAAPIRTMVRNSRSA
jgi:outer membrane cobalamin receptor